MFCLISFNCLLLRLHPFNVICLFVFTTSVYLNMYFKQILKLIVFHKICLNSALSCLRCSERERSGDVRGDAKESRTHTHTQHHPSPPHSPPAWRPFGLSMKRTRAMKNDFQFLPFANLFVWPEKEQPSSGDEWTSEQQRMAPVIQLELGRVALDGFIWYRLFHAFVLYLLLFSEVSLSSLSVSIWVRGRAMNPGQLTQTRLLFSLCSVKRNAPVEVGEASRITMNSFNPQNWPECSTVDLQFCSKYSTLFLHLLLGLPTMQTSHSHPQLVKRFFAHNHLSQRFKDSIQGGRQRYRPLGVREKDAALVHSAAACELIPAHDRMEPHGGGKAGRGRVRPDQGGRFLAS